MSRTATALGSVLAALINIAFALVLGAVLIAAVGEDPVAAFFVAITGAFGSLDGLAYTLHYATNFIFSGLAVAVAAHAMQFNIGGEGQAYVGGLGTLGICMLLPWAPWWAALPFAILASMAFGALWAFVPAYMAARRGSHLVITTIMFNFLASLLMIYLIVNHFREDGSMIPSSGPIAENLFLLRFDQILMAFGVEIPESPLNVMALVALAACAAITFLIWHTRWGYELRAVGANAAAASFAGVNVNRLVVQAICLSGGLAGLIAVNEIMGAQHRLMLDFALGYGFTGIAVAMIGANHPAGIMPAAILFGALYQGGASLSFLFPSVSRDVVTVLQGLVILFAGGLAHVLRPISIAAVSALLEKSKAGKAGVSWNS
ncbi:MAG TPA: ABC transporter permease [Mesorhizobium sp.]|uniref:ABC transporter permease n=1 Tax=Mesorhizobium sp. TaxID=1871066 RepID=UPI002DDDAA51|nr:ABC transporter permease [Mesorhizobium sp.]HEV2501672.1 ABC transporter permease [Mesorhizobium sp.]